MVLVGNNLPVTTKRRGRPAEDVDPNNNFGRWLRAERVARELTGEALAFAVGDGMTQGRISAYERGFKKPEPATVAQIATALGIDPQAGLDALQADTLGIDANRFSDDKVKELAQFLSTLHPDDQAEVWRYALYRASERGK